MKKARARITVTGLVQGVGFRASTVVTAKRHRVCGWVKNNPDGAVEAVLEGAQDAVEKVIEWCRTGPPMSRVDGVSVRWEEFKDEFDDFTAVTRHNVY